MFLVDSHCHLDLLHQQTNESTDAVLARAKAQGIKHILNVCVSLAQFPTVLKLAETYPFIDASVGLHPNDRTEEITLETLVKLAEHPKVIAIGEAGLDYFRSTGDLEWQRQRFRCHIQAAKQVQKPLIVHTRAAKEDTLAILQEEKADQIGGVMHCFTEDWETARKALDMNFYISFSGIVTFKTSTVLQEVAKKVPLERMLIETDAPYLAPNPHRGKTNEPAYVQHTAAFIANLRGITLDELAEQTTNNFFTLFKGAVPSHV